MEKLIQDMIDLRKKLNLSQEELARRFGVSWMTVQRWESGKTKPFGLYKQKIENFIKRHLPVEGATA